MAGEELRQDATGRASGMGAAPLSDGQTTAAHGCEALRKSPGTGATTTPRIFRPACRRAPRHIPHATLRSARTPRHRFFGYTLVGS